MKKLAICLFLLFVTTSCANEQKIAAMSANQKELQEQLSLKYARKNLELKNFLEATRYLDSIANDTKHAAEVEVLRKEAKQQGEEYEIALKKRFEQEEEVALNLQVDLRVCDNPKELTVQGKVILPKGSVLTVGLWRKDGSENWEKMDEETVEVEMGGRFVSSLSPFKENMRDNVTDLESMQEFLKNSYEVKVTSYFRNDKEQPQSVIKTVGEGGKKIAGEWVTDQGADGKAIIYSQKYQLNPSVHGPACFSFKPEKI